MTKKILLAIALFLVVIQFIKPDRNVSTTPSPNDIATKYTVPEGVQVSLKNACYDCHSNNTVYPWYANIQPVAWWLNKHIEEGKKHLNFSEFTTYSLKKADHKLEEVIESQEEKWMPLNEYTWMHPKAKLSDEERNAIVAWAKEVRGTIQADSLFKTEPDLPAHK